MIKTTIWRQVVIAALLAGGSFTVAANPPPPPPVSYGVEEDVFHPVRARQGMVASVDALATRVGVDILRQGGNAVDAAVAVGYALAVTHPQAGNIGGGGFMMLRTKDGKTTAIDFREMAPEQATRDMFLDDQGNPDSKKSLTSHLASGTPGSVAGFSLALEKYGTMPLNKVIRPAIKLAEEGFIVNDALADDLKTYGSEVIPQHENSKAIFWKNGEPLKKGDSVTLVVSTGPDKTPVTVISFLTYEQTTAVEEAETLGLKVTVKHVYSDALAGTVVEQSIAQDTVVTTGAEIVLTVSDGPDPSVSGTEVIPPEAA